MTRLIFGGAKILFLASLGILFLDISHWFDSGNWPDRNVLTLLEWMGIASSWTLLPTELVGLHKLCASVPLWLGLMLASFVSFFTPVLFDRDI